MNHYIHTVQYYETDKMGITHHSNYIRWMEEARIDFLDQIGWNYARLEREGIISPVVGVECRYKRPTTFDDQVEIEVRVEELRGVKLIIGYTMTDRASGAVVLEGKTTHCFTDANGKVIRLARQFPELARALEALAAENAEKEGE